MDESQITAPVGKAVTALSAGAGTSVAATMASNPGSFLPTDLSGWMALAASTAAVLYTLHLMGEWYWKKVLRPCFVARGWLPKPKGTAFVVDSDGNVERQEQ
jgi:hypothetical protein